MLKKILILLLLLSSALTLSGQKRYYSLSERIEAEENFIKGIFHYNNMEYTSAIEFLRKSLNFMPLNDRARYWLGKTYLMAGYKELAISEWEAIVRLSGADILLRQKLQQLYTESFLDDKVDLQNAFVLLRYLYSEGGISAMAVDEQNQIYLSNFMNSTIEIRDSNFNLLSTVMGKVQKPMDLDINQNYLVSTSFGDDKVMVFNKKNNQVLFEIGKFGINPGEFSGPSGVALHGNLVYVTDSGNNRVQVFRLSGDVQFLQTFGSKGREPGQFINPTDVVFFQDKIWVADAGNRRIQIFDESGNFLEQFGEDTLEAPRRLILNQNKLFILDENKGLLHYQLKEKQFQVIRANNQDIQKPLGAAFDPNGLLFLSDFFTNKISVYSPDKMKLSSLRLDSLLTLNTGYPGIAIKLRVQDVKGKDISGLASQNFKLYQEGEAITDFSLSPLIPEQKKVSLLVLNNTLDSMRRYKQESIDYFRKVLAGLKSPDRISIMNVGRSVSTIQPFTNQPLTLLDALNKTPFAGETEDFLDTALYQALAKNLNNEYYNAILLLEDGKRNAGFKKYSLEVLANFAKRNGVPIFTLAFDEGENTSSLKYLASETGGSYLHFYKSNKIYDLFSLLRSSQPLFYVLSYQSPQYAKINRHRWLSILLELNYKSLYSAEKTGFYIP